MRLLSPGGASDSPPRTCLKRSRRSCRDRGAPPRYPHPVHDHEARCRMATIGHHGVVRLWQTLPHLCPAPWELTTKVQLRRCVMTGVDQVNGAVLTGTLGP